MIGVPPQQMVAILRPDGGYPRPGIVASAELGC